MRDTEAVTPPRREANGHGGLRAPGSRLPPRGTRVAPQIFTEARVRYVSSDRRNVSWSPENILIDTVARLQQDWVDIRAESRQLRTPGVPPVVPTTPLICRREALDAGIKKSNHRGVASVNVC